LEVFLWERVNGSDIRSSEVHVTYILRFRSFETPTIVLLHSLASVVKLLGVDLQYRTDWDIEISQNTVS
jgi:hypothetical protein